MNIRRYGKVIGLRADRVKDYKRLHAQVWPEVNAAIHNNNVRNFSIFLRKLADGAYYLFMYFEHAGEDYEADMQKIAADPATQRWWRLTDPCQEPLPDRRPGEWWADMEEICHNP
jgi:L-rhamnose mutarotase